MILRVHIKLMQVYKKNIDYLRTAICVSDKNKRLKVTLSQMTVTCLAVWKSACATGHWQQGHGLSRWPATE
ncbi:hypothetical protein SAMN04487787_105200 [Kosakonia sacchari]|nr:hypothetical protein SAMN04487787_105200 [Kosakonia sacchari]